LQDEFISTAALILCLLQPMLCWLDRDAKTKLLRITKKPLLSDLSRWFGRERGPLQARQSAGWGWHFREIIWSL